MSGSVNKAILLGNVGRDPEVKATQNGGTIVNLSIATSESWRDKSTGERKERTEWHRVVIFNEKIAEIVQKYVTKGAKIYIEGQIASRKWTDQSGNERTSTEIVLPRFGGALTLLGDKADREGQAGAGEAPAGRPAARGTDELNDDIPF